MMTLVQFYLTKISEEADEIAQIALKAQQFGLSEMQPGRDKSNAQRMYGELNDLLAMVHRLGEISQGEFFFDIGAPDHVAIATKLAKVEKYLAYSRSLGLVEPEQPVSLQWLEGLMDSMLMELAAELSDREETKINGHTLVVECRRNEVGRYGQWIVDGKELVYEAAIVAVMRPVAVPQIEPMAPKRLDCMDQVGK